MHSCRETRVAVALALCFGLLPSAGAAEEPLPGDPFAIRLRLEMAAHRRLTDVMDKVGHKPAPFVTDGCSGGLSMAWEVLSDVLPSFAKIHQERPPWEDCCITHDRAYHAAAGAATAEEGYRARFEADEDLRECVIETGAHRAKALMESYGLTEAQVDRSYALVAQAMFDAVRFGGGPCSGLPWRWGYGYPDCLWGE